MAQPTPLDAGLHKPDDFLATLTPDDLVYFLCNIGDGDAQLVVLPTFQERRQVLVIDAGARDKLPALVRALASQEVLSAPSGELDPDTVALVVATHPHHDHIAGIGQFLTEFGDVVSEFWDPGYYHPSAAYHHMMAAVEDNGFSYLQPTSGMRRWIGNVAITVLSPAIGLRNRFDSYGININDSSLSLRIEFPAARVVTRDEGTGYIRQGRTQSLILGADAQTLSWSYVATDFPQLVSGKTNVSKQLRMATGADLLSADVFKVSHHGSKHGVNLELIERIDPELALISSVGGEGKYGFPHSVAQEIIREALDPTTSSGLAHKLDPDLRLLYTSDVNTNREVLGSVAIVMSKGNYSIWRFRDASGEDIAFDRAVRLQAD